MTLRMADGPVANLPAGMDAYAGYVNRSGIGITYPQVVAWFPNALHLSITTDGSTAQCADVESGAMTDWRGYAYGYCSVSRVNDLVKQFGRPKKLWTSHYDPKIGAHICSPKCWPGLVTTADGTQWTDHGGWDESVLADDFFALAPRPQPIPDPTKGVDPEMITSFERPDGSIVTYLIAPGDSHVIEMVRKPGAAGFAATGENTSVIDITSAFPAQVPA